MNVVPLFPLEMRTALPRYDVSSHPFASSPSKENGTGYGTRAGRVPGSFIPNGPVAS